MIDVKLDPDASVIAKRLDNFADTLQRKAVTAGLSAAAAPVKKRMRSNAPKQPGGGALRKSIGHRQLTARDRAVLRIDRAQRGVFVGPIRKVADPKYARSPGKKIAQGFKAYWLEYTGAQSHGIPLGRTRRGSARRKILKFDNGDFAYSVIHPGFRTKKFIGPALSAAGNQLEAKFFTGMANKLDKLDAT